MINVEKACPDFETLTTEVLDHRGVIDVHYFNGTDIAHAIMCVKIVKGSESRLLPLIEAMVKDIIPITVFVEVYTRSVDGEMVRECG